jgi:GTP-binding protein
MSLRNIAIIAHVDHGKTTLVDQLLAQSGVFRAHEATVERAMDSNDQERERGITILAKCTSVLWHGKAGETRINIIDTPGHADFGGEVERILGMVDGCVLLVDAEEGVMPQTKFVLGKALKMGLRPILCLNKVDRPHADPDRVHNEAFDLFAALGASDEQLDFPHIYASGKNGWATLDLAKPNADMAPLFDLIVDHVPPPRAESRKDEPFRMLSVLIEADPFLGRLLTGRIEAGKAVPGLPIKALSRDGKEIERGRITKVLAFRGLKRQPIDEAEAGDIVAIAGLSKATVADTLCALEVTEALPAQPIDPPTISMTVSVNDSPLAGREGDKVQSRVIAARLQKEAESNVAIRVTETAEKDAYEVAGRGELQLGVLIESMRREGFEVSISRPRVVFQADPETGERLEPIEDVVIDVDDEFTGVVIEKLSARKAELKDMRPSGTGKTRITLESPSRPASGLSLIETVMAMVGGSIGWAGRASVTSGAQTVSATVALASPAMATMSPASASSIGWRFSPRKASTLVMRPRSISLPSCDRALIGRPGTALPASMRPVSRRPRNGSASISTDSIWNGSSARATAWGGGT